MKTKNLVLCALFAAITAVLAQIIIPLPGGVPFTLQTLAVSFCGIMLGAKKGFISQLVYVAMGAVGLPVFAGFSGGFQIVVGPTGGFILSFPLMALIIGYVSEKTNNKTYIFLGMIAGSIVNYLIGMIQFSAVTNSGLLKAFMLCVLPFIIGGLIKAFVAMELGLKLKNNVAVRSSLMEN